MQPPYLLFLGAEPLLENTKTGAGLCDWRPELCLGQHRLSDTAVNLGLPDLTLQEAIKQGAKTLVIGVSPAGGSLDESWLPTILSALELGMDVAAGLHQRLNDHTEISRHAREFNRRLFDVRQPAQTFAVGTGKKRTGKRLLTVGSDCAVGKKYTALAIEKDMRRRGLAADFRATGQTGVLIAGGGFAIDAVVSDFLSGAVESLSPDNAEQHWDIIEGQGSLYHPSYAAVTVGLVHGSQADALVLCHDASRTSVEDVEGYPIVELGECMQGYLAIARLTNPNVRFVGISVNTSRLDAPQAEAYLAELETRYGLPCCDPVRGDVSAIVDNLLAQQ